MTAKAIYLYFMEVLVLKIDARINTLRVGQNPAAYVSVTLDGCVAIKGVKVFDGEKGRYIRMPSIKDSKREYKDVCFPVTRDFRAQMSDIVLAAYERALFADESK